MEVVYIDCLTWYIIVTIKFSHYEKHWSEREAEQIRRGLSLGIAIDPENPRTLALQRPDLISARGQPCSVLHDAIPETDGQRPAT